MHPLSMSARAARGEMLQVASHAQKFFLRASKAASKREKKRPSIHDIRETCPADSSLQERDRLRVQLQQANESCSTAATPPFANPPCEWSPGTRSSTCRAMPESGRLTSDVGWFLGGGRVVRGYSHIGSVHTYMVL
jgi:hypothetical protein